MKFGLQVNLDEEIYSNVITLILLIIIENSTNSTPQTLWHFFGKFQFKTVNLIL